MNELSEECIMHITRRAYLLIPGEDQESFEKRKIFELGMVEALTNLKTIKFAGLILTKISKNPPSFPNHIWP